MRKLTKMLKLFINDCSKQLLNWWRAVVDSALKTAGG